MRAHAGCLIVIPPSPIIETLVISHQSEAIPQGAGRAANHRRLAELHGKNPQDLRKAIIASNAP